jgi:hypothetical protein
MFPLTRSTSRNRFWRALSASSPIFPLDSLSAAAAVGTRRLRTDYDGQGLRVRRSADNAERDIPLITAPQTRTNLAAIPINNNGGVSVAGLTMTTVGSGTEFGQPYVDVQWQGTATAAGFIQFVHSATGAFNSAIHAPVAAGLVYTASLGMRVVAGTLPAGSWAFRGSCRDAAGSTTFNQGLVVASPSGVLRRYTISFMAPSGSAYCQPNAYCSIALNEVVNITLRFYAANVEQGIGNLRPLLQRDVPEVVADVGGLDLEALATFVGGENLLTQSDDVSNIVWTATGLSAVLPGQITENASGGTHRLSRNLTLAVGVHTLSAIVRRAVGSRQFQLGVSGAGLVGRAYFDLDTGTVGLADQGSGSITALPGGDYRVSLTVTVATAGSHSIFLAMTNSATILGSETYTADGNGSMFVRSAQLNQGPLMPYNPTTTTAIALTTAHNGFVPTWYDQGRFWHATRRNRLARSEQFENAYWTGDTVTANVIDAPDGTRTADLCQVNGSSTQRGAFTVAANTVVTASCHFKAGTTGDWVRIVVLDPLVTTNQVRAWFNLSTRTVGTNEGTGTNTYVGADVEQLADGWFRAWVTGSIPGTNLVVQISNENGDGIIARTSGHNRHQWGAQVDIGSLTDYQPILDGNPLDLTQSTAANQPQIVVAGAVHTDSGRVSVLVPAFGFIERDFGTISQPATRSYVITRKDSVVVGSNAHYVGNFGTNPNTTEYGVNATTMNQYAGGTPNAQTVQPFALNETGVFTSIYNNTVGSSLSKNGAVLTAPANGGGTGAVNGLRIGSGSGAVSSGPLSASEVMVFASALSAAQRQTLERNQGQHFGLYTPGAVLDGLTVNAAAAYSLRRVNGWYNGPAIGVRRSDDTVLDIGFTPAGDLDTVALLAFVGAGDGFVTTWYDQSGNGRNAVQATAANQPRIVNAGAVETAGGRSAFVFDGTDDAAVTASWGTIPQPFTRNAVVQLPATIVSSRRVMGSGNAAILEYHPNAATLQMFASGNGPSMTVAGGERIVYTATYDAANSTFTKNGMVNGPGTVGTASLAGLVIGAGTPAGFLPSQTTVQELIVWTSALPVGDRQTLERNQGAYYAIPVV